jgi:hydrogenase maturation protease
VSARVLVAGVGNLFLGDDAFGCEVARALAARPLPPGVAVRDFGTRSMDLACELVAGWDAAIFVDAAPRGAAAGTLTVLDPQSTLGPSPVDGHTLRLHRVLPLARQLGALPPTLRLIACEPASIDGEDAGVGLSPEVAAAIAPAVALAEKLLARLPEASP